MKRINLLTILVLVMVLTMLAPASGRYDPFDNHLETDEPPQDHPWGGDVTPPNDDPSTNLGGMSTLVGSPRLSIELFRIIILFDFSFDRNWYYDNTDNDVLPGDVNPQDNNSGDPVRGN